MTTAIQTNGVHQSGTAPIGATSTSGLPVLGDQSRSRFARGFGTLVPPGAPVQRISVEIGAALASSKSKRYPPHVVTRERQSLWGGKMKRKKKRR